MSAWVQTPMTSSGGSETTPLCTHALMRLCAKRLDLSAMAGPPLLSVEHLTTAFRIDGRPVNPLEWLRGKK